MMWRVLMLCIVSRPASALASTPLYVECARFCQRVLASSERDLGLLWQ